MTLTEAVSVTPFSTSLPSLSGSGHLLPGGASLAFLLLFCNDRWAVSLLLGVSLLRAGHLVLASCP